MLYDDAFYSLTPPLLFVLSCWKRMFHLLEEAVFIPYSLCNNMYSTVYIIIAELQQHILTS